MNGLTKIIEKILADAQVKAAQIVSQAENLGAEMRAEAEKERTQLISQAVEDGERNAKALNVRAESLAVARDRREQLDQRQAEITQVIDQALTLLNQRSPQDRIAHYVSLIKNRGLSDGEILLKESEQALLPELLTQLGEGFTAGEPAAISGGLLVRRGNILENFSYDLIIRNNRPELTAVAAGVLFPSSSS